MLGVLAFLGVSYLLIKMAGGVVRLFLSIIIFLVLVALFPWMVLVYLFVIIPLALMT